MNRPIFACAFFALATTALVAQESSPYQGTSNPPPDDTIITTEQQPPTPKLSPAHPVQQASPAAQTVPAPITAGQRSDSGDQGIVNVAPSAPRLNTRAGNYDPDSDIVHPAPLPPGTIGEGTLIRVKLLDELSSNLSEKGEPFRSRVATDVVQGGQVVIPAGAEIDGRVAEISTGHLGGHGSILLEPAMVASTPGTNARVNSEGVITPGSRLKRDGIEYAGVGGGGMIVGAALGGPVGMLAGGLVGAGVVTTHLLQSHPQTTLEEGSYLMLTVTEQVQLVPATPQGN
jgi:hypothetical protein